MNIVITMAGHSRRFKEAGYTEPKAFLDVNGAPMISRIVDMFSPSDKFYYVINRDHLKSNPAYEKILSSLAANFEIVPIAPHEVGPVHTALQVKSISDDEEVIVTYCDFFVEWDYRQFLNLARRHDAAMATFRGFHPASFGKTYYAYIRTEGERMLELREKQSFTADRTEEQANAGVYYFRSWQIFREYSEKLLKKGTGNLKEAYVSLPCNLIVEDGLSVGFFEVKKFICWGTPEDYEHYKFWARYFSLRPQDMETARLEPLDKTVNLIPMAGRGSRFQEFGYKVGKPLIQINSMPMAIKSMLSFPPASRWIFLPRQEQLDKSPVARALTQFAPASEIIGVKGNTSGQAATCLLARDSLSPGDPLFIASCDYQTIYNFEKWKRLTANPSVDAVVWTFRLGSTLVKNYDAFAYCDVENASGRVRRIVEKKTISDHPEHDPTVVGSFWFRRTKDFIACAENCIAENRTVNGEHYVGTSMNWLIEQGKKVVIFEVDQWISFGDPFELRLFDFWQEHFSS